MMTNEELDRLKSLEVDAENTREILAGLKKVCVELVKSQARQDIQIEQMDLEIKEMKEQTLEMREQTLEIKMQTENIKRFCLEAYKFLKDH